MDFNDKEHIFIGLYKKFADEEVDIDQESYAVYDIIEQFQEILKYDLIPIMCNKSNINKLHNYIISL